MRNWATARAAPPSSAVLAIIEHAAGQLGRGAQAPSRVDRRVVRNWATAGARGPGLHKLAVIETRKGNPAEAPRRLCEESIEINKEMGNLYGIASSLGMLAQLTVLEGRFEEAVAQGREAVRLLEEIGSFKAAWARESLKAIEARAATIADA